MIIPQYDLLVLKSPGKNILLLQTEKTAIFFGFSNSTNGMFKHKAKHKQPA